MGNLGGSGITDFSDSRIPAFVPIGAISASFRTPSPPNDRSICPNKENPVGCTTRLSPSSPVLSFATSFIDRVGVRESWPTKENRKIVPGAITISFFLYSLELPGKDPNTLLPCNQTTASNHRPPKKEKHISINSVQTSQVPSSTGAGQIPSLRQWMPVRVP